MKKLFTLRSFLFLAIFLLLFFILVFFHFRGLIYYDEGYILNSALRVAHGQIPYRDFDVVYTPLSFIITSGFFTLFGESVFASRVAALTISLFSLFALYKILQIITKNIFIQIICLLFFIAWGPAHSNFVWPVMFAICSLFYTLYFYLLGTLYKKKKYFFLAGVMTIFIFLSKQNFGTGIFFITTISFLFLPLKNKKQYLINYFYGITSISLLSLLIFLVTSSLVPFLQNMSIYTLKRVLVQKALDTSFIYGDSLIEKIAKFFFYTSPLFLSILAFLFRGKTRQKFLIIYLSVAMFYLSGIRPTTDYNHLAPLLALSCLSLVCCITFAKKLIVKKIFFTLLIALTVLGFYTAFTKGHYRWDYALKDQNVFSQNARVHIYTSKSKVEEVDRLYSTIQSNTVKGQYIFVNYYAPFIYFLVNRENPTRYDFISANELPVDYQINALDRLKDKNVKVVVIHIDSKNENSIIANFIRKNYYLNNQVGDLLIYTK